MRQHSNALPSPSTRTDDDTNTERDFIVTELSKSRVLADATSYKAGEQLSAGRVNHYVADGDVSVATLVDDSRP
jgi:hypothetical protein